MATGAKSASGHKHAHGFPPWKEPMPTDPPYPGNWAATTETHVLDSLKTLIINPNISSFHFNGPQTLKIWLNRNITRLYDTITIFSKGTGCIISVYKHSLTSVNQHTTYEYADPHFPQNLIADINEIIAKSDPCHQSYQLDVLTNIPNVLDS